MKYLGLYLFLLSSLSFGQNQKASEQSNMLPPGVIMPYVGTTAPPGWLMCDGTSYPRSSYPNLAKALNCSGLYCSFGAASTTHFNVPDLRGRFLRGVDGTAGRDPDKNSRTAMASGGNAGNNVGSVQDEQIKTHNHDVGSYNTYSSGSHTHSAYTTIQLSGSNTGNVSSASAGSGSGGYTNFTTTVSSSGSHNHSLYGSSANTGGNETRPINAYVNYIIKY